MIENYETDDFERTLKEHADRFTLIPSERVWKSIYNDLHPGSKWPSLTAGLFILVVLVWLGDLNRSTNNSTNDTHNTEIIETLPDKSVLPSTAQVSMDVQSMLPDDAKVQAINKTTSVNSKPVSRSADNTRAEALQNSATDIAVALAIPAIPVAQQKTAETNNKAFKTKKHRLSNEILPESVSSGNNGAVTSDKQDHRSIDVRSGIRQKLKWEFFINPMISNVHFGGANLNKTTSSVVYTPVSNHSMDIAKRLGFMSGIRGYYPLSKKLSLVTGAQVIYTGYNIYSEVKMPDIASLTFKDSKGKLFSKNYVSYYANENKGGTKSITNYNWQLSIPIGLKYDFYTNKQIQLSVVSTVEPLVVLGSKAYLLSGDASSYVTDPDLVRRFNVSGNVGTLISFNSDNTQWKIGPNVRYQILSTYGNIYPVREHFISYGIHVGVSKK